MLRKFLLLVLKGKLVVFKSTIAMWTPEAANKLEESLLFDIDTMIDKINYYLEVM